MQTTEFLYAVAIFALSALALDLGTARGLAHEEWSVNTDKVTLPLDTASVYRRSTLFHARGSWFSWSPDAAF